MTFTGERLNKIPWEERVQQILVRTKNTEDTEFKEWLMSKSHLKVQFDQLTYRMAYNVYKELNDDNDHLSVVIGREGVGKSTFSINYCCLVSPTFNMSQIVYSVLDFLKACMEAEPGDSILIDEGAALLFARNFMTSGNKELIQVMQEIRQLRIHLVLCIPSLKNLDSYLRTERLKTLFRVFRKGAFQCYFSKSLQQYIDINLKNKRGFVNSSQTYKGAFVKGLPKINDIQERNYKDKKQFEFRTKVGNMIDKYEAAEQEELENNKPNDYISLSVAARKLGVSSQTLRNRIQSGKLEAERFGNKFFVHKSVCERRKKPKEETNYIV